ncbi:MAG: NmrA family NAD(P)-binding protein [Pseudomonadota bacterium]
MSGSPKILVAGATGQVGSQVVKALLRKGYAVRALMRRPDAIVHGAEGKIEYAIGSIEDIASLERALVGIETVISSANGIIPSGATMSTRAMHEKGYEGFIAAAERAGVRHWIQSSVPVHELEARVPELAGKRIIEKRLNASPIAATIFRNPAFMDVWLVMIGAVQAMGDDPHSTCARQFGFVKFWQRLTGNLVQKRGILLAPGGRDHGAPMISTRDVAEMMAATVGKQAAHNRTIEAGGPEWITWGQVADLMSKKAGRKVRAVTMPAWFAAIGQALTQPFFPAASNVLGLTRFVAAYQPRWDSAPIVEEFDLPPQLTVAEYLDRNWHAR